MERELIKYNGLIVKKITNGVETFFCKPCQININFNIVNLNLHVINLTHTNNVQSFNEKVYTKKLDLLNLALKHKILISVDNRNLMHCVPCRKSIDDRLPHLLDHVSSLDHAKAIAGTDSMRLLQLIFDEDVLQLVGTSLRCNGCHLPLSFDFSKVKTHLETLNHITKTTLHLRRKAWQANFNKELFVRLVCKFFYH